LVVVADCPVNPAVSARFFHPQQAEVAPAKEAAKEAVKEAAKEAVKEAVREAVREDFTAIPLGNILTKVLILVV
jgi:hypothetical protein